MTKPKDPSRAVAYYAARAARQKRDREAQASRVALGETLGVNLERYSVAVACSGCVFERECRHLVSTYSETDPYCFVTSKLFSRYVAEYGASIRGDGGQQQVGVII